MREQARILVLTIAGTAACASAFAQQNLQWIAYAGQQAPGAPQNQAFAVFGWKPAINDRNSVAFSASLIGPGVDLATNAFGIWRAGPTSSTLVARAGQAVPGVSGGVFSGFSTQQSGPPILMDNLDSVAFVGNFRLANVSHAALCRSGALVPHLVAYHGGPISGVSGAVLNDTLMNAFTLGPTGLLVYPAAFASNAGQCMLVDDGSSPQAWLVTGTNLPGTSEQILAPLGSDASPSNAATWHGRSSVRGPNQLTSWVVWEFRDGVATVVLRRGDSLPGIDQPLTGAAWRTNASGDAVVWGTVSGTPTDARTGVWVLDPLLPRLIIAENDPVPGVDGRTFAELTGVSYADSGRIVVEGAMSETNGVARERGVWAGSGDALSKVAAAGDQVPGQPAGIVFDEITGQCVNSAGRIAVVGTFTVEGNPRTGVLVEDDTGELRMLLATGMTVVLPNGLPFELTSVYAGGNLSEGIYGSRRWMNAEGRVVCRVTWEDELGVESGIVTVGLAPPAPQCDLLDFNRDDQFPDTRDIADFLNVFAGGVCEGQQPGDTPCNPDIDFNNDGLSPDPEDVGALLRVFSGDGC